MGVSQKLALRPCTTGHDQKYKKNEFLCTFVKVVHLYAQNTDFSVARSVTGENVKMAMNEKRFMDLLEYALH